MLAELEINNLGPIRHARMNPHAGMTAITGETGSGKSMLLNALRLISGQNIAGITDKITQGAEELRAQGVFDIEQLNADAPLRTVLHDAGIDCEDELFMSRLVPLHGRSRTVIAGHSAPRSLAHDISEQCITIHGQTDQLKLASSARQRLLLDAFANQPQQVQAYAQAWEQCVALAQQLSDLLHNDAQLQQRADYLKDSLTTIDRVDPHDNEDIELQQRRSFAENASQIKENIVVALNALDSSSDSYYNEDGMEQLSASQQIGIALNALESLQKISGMEFIADTYNTLYDVAEQLNTIVYQISSAMPEDVMDYNQLDEINNRIHALQELTRRWGPQISDVLKWKEEAEQELLSLDNSPERIESLQAAFRESLNAVALAGHQLHEVRVAAATVLAERVNAELGSLAMVDAQLRIDVEEQHLDDTIIAQCVAEGTLPPQYDSSGADHVAFQFMPFAGAKALPLGNSASGGELSRLMLAIELATATYQADTEGMTFVFDEVDAGVGGSAAIELGKRLAQLAQHAQVIVVTHLPQVASWAQSQFVVSKEKSADAASSTGSQTNPMSAENHSVETDVHEVTGEQRIEEIARMLAGDITATSLQHARELLEASTL